MPKSNLPSVEYLWACFREENGKIYWLARPREHFENERGYKVFAARFAGKEAGSMCLLPPPTGPRWFVRLKRQCIYRYVLVWALRTGELPSEELDHKNHDSLDDQFDNLRLATSGQNKANMRRRKDNTSGFKGVCWLKRRQKWLARLNLDGKSLHLGTYATCEEAHDAYLAAARKHYGEFACGG